MLLLEAEDEGYVTVGEGEGGSEVESEGPETETETETEGLLLLQKQTSPITKMGGINQRAVNQWTKNGWNRRRFQAYLLRFKGGPRASSVLLLNPTDSRVTEINTATLFRYIEGRIDTGCERNRRRALRLLF
ncbi:hypothetical protein CDL15_Pgr011802 [Punica granatum]|uniref:Uncharacterized protein n=1 Tax=Punica granatum TaxID=22663 RepID=A0A218XEF4_PUNGR|nr:hypothetical protein CDL15_Pgr011802 [Punica granatum]PKI33868.1 hypothetical protein CRG98_045739 [Punica granatum]